MLLLFGDSKEYEKFAHLYGYHVDFVFDEDPNIPFENHWSNNTRVMGKWCRLNLDEEAVAVLNDCLMTDPNNNFKRLITYGFKELNDFLLFKLTWK